MSVPIPFPDPARGDQAAHAQRLYGGAAAVTASLAVVAGTALLGVAAGYCWAAVAPRAWLVMTGPGAASVINPETSAYIAADVAFCLVCLVGGVLSGVLGYLFVVRKHGPLGMAGLIAGALAAAFVTRWTGEHSGLATFQHLLATLPVRWASGRWPPAWRRAALNWSTAPAGTGLPGTGAWADRRRPVLCRPFAMTVWLPPETE
jgi:hypothetical protein